MQIPPLNHTATAILRRLLRGYVWPQRKPLTLAILFMIVVAGATAANAWLMQPVLDEIFINHNESMLRLLPFVIFGIAVISGAANYGQIVMMRYVGRRITGNMQLDLFKHLVHSDLTLFHNQGAGQLISRFTYDINLIHGAVSNFLVAVAKQSLTLVFLLAVMLHQNWKLTVLSFAVYLIAIYPLMRWSKRMRQIYYKSLDKLGTFGTQLEEVFQGIRTVKSYAREPYEIRKTGDSIEQLFKLYFRAARIGAASSPLMETLGGIAIGSVIWYGGAQVMSGTTTPGAFMSFIAALIMAYKPAKSMSGMGSTLQEGLAATNRFYNILDTKPAIVDKPGATQLAVKNGAITYENVTFHYGSDTAGVDKVSLEIPAGKTAALVGLSGGGKSTLMNLLLRFYEVDSGVIKIDGQDIRDVTLHSLRGAMGFVPQESMLFDDTVRANIAYGREGASEAEIMMAAKNAAADEFIRALPQGYDTMIGSHGVRLSGGQRQRLAIARAMLKNAPILLLDEATSSLDNESERSIQEALKILMRGRTTLVIAHRLSTIVGADVIYVVEGGRIIETGTHDSLMKTQGKYYRLYAQNAEAGLIQ